MRYAGCRVEITPQGAVPLAGYYARGTAPARGTHDPLSAALLLLTDDGGGSAVCWVTLDILDVDTATAARIRAAVAVRAGIDEASVLVCASHSHSAPAAWLRPELPALAFSHNGAETDDRPLDTLVERISRAAGELSETEPARASYTIVPDVGVGGNRYEPGGPHVSGTGVLSIRDTGGSLRAVAFDYACHPTVLGHDNLYYSADYLAGARRALSAALAEVTPVAEPPVLVFLQGAAGDASTRFTRREQTFAEADRHGGILAGAVLRGALATGSPARLSVPAVRGTSVRVPTRRLPEAADVAREIADAERRWRATDPADAAAERIARTRHEGTLMLARTVETGLPPEVELPVTVVTLGDVAWVHLPIEPFATVADTIARGSPYRHTRVVGYTDGYFGYLADEPAHEARVYEAASSLFDAPGADTIVTAATTLLRSRPTGKKRAISP